ncbi:MAG: coagulation factor 5/8 type domain-containing protein [Opitutae bacterium]|nr:coagulation factor 5/8 type domain-containing protein [Opitutae bacterium]
MSSLFPRLLAGLAPLALLSFAAAPDFGPNVLIFSPGEHDVQARIDAVFAQQERSEFGAGRYALLFRPGDYAADVQVGYYMHVAGLGRSPDDVRITGAVRCTAKWTGDHNATINFWRTAENLSVTPTVDGGANVWAVSQGTSLRRVHVRGDLHLWDGGWASGGFMADCRIDGRVDSGTQQQWLSRNDSWGQWVGSSWNMVFVGVDRPPAGRWPDPAYTVVEHTPISREKPYLFTDANGAFFVFVPDFSPPDTRGITWSAAPTPGRAVSIDEFHIARPETDTAATLNAALAAGKHLLFTPGSYRLDAPLEVTRAETIVFGLGFPTLISAAGQPVLRIADVEGVVACGLLLEASEREAPVLLQVGSPGGAATPETRPTVLHDLFARAGSTVAGRTRCFVEVNSSGTILDNLWLWRADHGPGAGWEKNRTAHGLVVNGRDVTAYGLFVEHTQDCQTLWNADGGRVYLYQSELPYDPPNQAAWMNGAARGFASYKVADRVRTHEAWGVGVYAVFHHTPVILDNAVEAPAAPGVKFHHLVTLRLNRQRGSGIAHIINGVGAPVIDERMARVDEH